MQLLVSKLIKPLKSDWRRLALALAALAVALNFIVLYTPAEFRMIAAMIPIIVLVTAAFTYWMVIDSVPRNANIEISNESRGRAPNQGLLWLQFKNYLMICRLPCCVWRRTEKSNQPVFKRYSGNTRRAHD